MRSLSIAFIVGLLAGSAVAEDLSATSLYILLITLLLAGIFFSREWLRTISFFLAFFVVGVLRMTIADVPLHLDGLVESFEPLRRQLSDGFVSFGISGDENAVVNAMALGDKSGISPQLKYVYSQTGASYVLALSGMHLAIIYFILSWVVMRTMLWLYVVPELLWEKLPVENNTRLRRIIKMFLRLQPSEQLYRNIISFVILLIIWLYVILVGMSPSVVRSAVMLSIYGISRMLFRKHDVITVLALTAFLTLMISPLSLFDVGFQMSYLAVLGIGVYMPYLMQLVYKKDYNWSEDSSTSILRKILLWVYGSLALSFSAQIMVMPLVAYYFHSLPCYGLLSSLVVSVTAMLIVGLSFAFLASLFLPLALLSEALAYMLSAVARLQNVFLEHVIALPNSVIADVNINIWQLLIIYVIIFCLSRIAFILLRTSFPSRY
jgi:competence protein ComEC